MQPYVFPCYLVPMTTAVRDATVQYVSDPENAYLLRHYVAGDDGVVPWIAGALNASGTWPKGATLESVSAEVRQALDGMK